MSELIWLSDCHCVVSSGSSAGVTIGNGIPLIGLASEAISNTTLLPRGNTVPGCNLTKPMGVCNKASPAASLLITVAVMRSPIAGIFAGVELVAGEFADEGASTTAFWVATGVVRLAGAVLRA